MISSGPTDFAGFVHWLRQRTEAAWAALAAGDRAGWQKDTKWRGGLSADQVASAEAFFGHPFPEDYRLFLSTLHTTTRPPKRMQHGAAEAKLTDDTGFYDWMNDREALRQAVSAPVEGLLFDVEHNGLWLAEWGARPDSAKERQAVVRREATNSSPLIPVFGHRYLVAKPNGPGNPVLSIMQSDIIVYGDDLRGYLLAELADLLKEPSPPPTPAKSAKNVRLWGWFT